MQSLLSKLTGAGVLALGLALVPATLPAQNNSASSGKQAATAPNQNGNAATSNSNDQNGNAVNPDHPNQAAVPPAGTTSPANTANNTGADGSWGLWGLLGLLGFIGLAGGRRRRSTSVESADREIDRHDDNRRVA